MIYFFILMPLLTLAVLDCAHVRNNYRTQISRALLLTLIITAGLRTGTGTDWAAYKEIYTDFFESERVEVLYRIANNAFSQSGIHYNIFLLFLNFLSLSALLLAIKSQSKYFFVAYLIFYCDLFFYYNLSGQRQAVAFGLTTAAIILAANKRYAISTGFILLATGFHITALLTLLIFTIPRKRLKLHHLALPGAAIATTAFFSDQFLQSISAYTLKDYGYYLNAHEKSDQIVTEYIIGGIRRIFPLVAIYLARAEFFKSEKSYFLINLYLVGLAIYFTFYLLSPDIGVRVSSYFLAAELLMIGHLIQISDKTIRAAIITFYTTFSVYKVIAISSSSFYIYNSIVSGT